MQVHIYTKPNCQPCRATKQKLTEAGIPFTELDATAAPDYLRSLGATAAPVVLVIEGNQIAQSWWGLRPDRIRGLIEAYKRLHQEGRQ